MKMKLKNDRVTGIDLKSIFSLQTNYNFNSLCVGTIFRQTGSYLTIGGEDGIIRLFDLNKELKTAQVTMETKGGPIQCMAMEDITKFYHNDLIVADSHGMMTVFCNQQILCRQSVSFSCINCIQTQTNSSKNLEIVMSNDSGEVFGVLPSKELWRININDLSKDATVKSTITCLLAVDLPDLNGKLTSYILAADSSCNLNVIHQGQIVYTIKTPSVVSAMCAGKFVDPSKLTTPPTAVSPGTHQVALGTESGAVYIFCNFSVTEEEYVNAGYTVTSLKNLELPEYERDGLICTGHFNALHIYVDGKKLCHHVTSDWINCIDTTDVDQDGHTEIIVGCLDRTVHGYKIIT